MFTLETGTRLRCGFESLAGRESAQHRALREQGTPPAGASQSDSSGCVAEGTEDD